MFDNSEIFYFNNPKDFIFDDDWCLDLDKILSLKQKNSLIVADFSTDHYGIDGLDHVYQALDQCNINFLLLTHNPADHKKYPRIFFHNLFYQRLLKIDKPLTELKQNCTYTWSCLNLDPRPHRIYNYLLSRQQDYFSQAYFSFFNLTIGRRPDDIELPTEMQQQWDHIKNSLPCYPPKEVREMNLSLPALTDSYIHLITETTVIPKIFISEKTWKPIASRQFFLTFGNPGTVEFLRSLGVDVFDDIVDHTYDKELDWNSRLLQIHQEIKRLVDLDLQDLWNQTSQRRQANFDKFWSGNFDSHYSKEIKQAIDHYIALNK